MPLALLAQLLYEARQLLQRKDENIAALEVRPRVFRWWALALHACRVERLVRGGWHRQCGTGQEGGATSGT